MKRRTVGAGLRPAPTRLLSHGKGSVGIHRLAGIRKLVILPRSDSRQPSCYSSHSRSR